MFSFFLFHTTNILKLGSTYKWKWVLCVHKVLLKLHSPHIDANSLLSVEKLRSVVGRSDWSSQPGASLMLFPIHPLCSLLRVQCSFECGVKGKGGEFGNMNQTPVRLPRKGPGCWK